MIDLYSGPWYGPSNKQNKPASKGPAVIALKRTVSRIDPTMFPWREFDAGYNRRLERAVAAIQRKHNILGTGQTGEPTFRLLQRLERAGYPHEKAMDSVAINLLEDAWAKLHPPVDPIEKVYDAINEFWNGMCDYASIWHYLQSRPFRNLGRWWSSGGYSDCSEATTCSLYIVRKMIGIYCPDPNGRGFDGWGNTDTQYQVNRGRQVTNGVYKIGDLCIYGTRYKTKHVTQCMEPGSSSKSVWGSNGSESAPNKSRVYYRGDLLAVVRPILIPAHA